MQMFISNFIWQFEYFRLHMGTFSFIMISTVLDVNVENRQLKVFYFFSLEMIEVGVLQFAIMGGAEWSGSTADRRIQSSHLYSSFCCGPLGLSEGMDHFLFFSGIDSPHFSCETWNDRFGSWCFSALLRSASAGLTTATSANSYPTYLPFLSLQQTRVQIQISLKSKSVSVSIVVCFWVSVTLSWWEDGIHIALFCIFNELHSLWI